MRRRNDLGLYDRHARDWWDGASAFAASLHEVNRVRLGLIHGRLGPRLDGMIVVDLGCGGGLLAEPIARSGALVTGIDISAPSLHAAAAHGRPLTHLSYVRGDARSPPYASAAADLVLCADVLEHVTDWQRVLRAARALMRPATGQLFVTTINRTWSARILAVEIGERLGFVPAGTHDPALFIAPDDLVREAQSLGLQCSDMVGFTPRLAATIWARRLRMRISRSLAVEYAAWFTIRST